MFALQALQQNPSSYEKRAYDSDAQLISGLRVREPWRFSHPAQSVIIDISLQATEAAAFERGLRFCIMMDHYNLQSIVTIL
jgi:hypothetical protein